jgi:Mg/Co/Ni transporter MgtE
MKTVEQWMQGKRDALSSDLSCQAWIQAIQLDAKRCGMTHAIMIVNNHSRRAGATADERSYGFWLADAISKQIPDA